MGFFGLSCGNPVELWINESNLWIAGCVLKISCVGFFISFLYRFLLYV